MTEEELNYLTDLKNRFWHEFSDLCERYIQEAADRFPDLSGPRYQDFIGAAVMMLGESTSIYGRRSQ